MLMFAEAYPFSVAGSDIPRLDPVSYSSALPAAARPAILDVDAWVPMLMADYPPVIDDYISFDDPRDF